MRHHLKAKRSIRPLFLAAALAAALIALFAASSRGQAPAAAQSATPAAPVQASPAAPAGRPQFDVASVKPSKSGDRPYSNVPLRAGVIWPANGGLFSASNMPLLVYISFAYDLSSAELLHLQPQLPKWATSEGFDIQARAEGNQTREQMALMLQSLLEDRFKLKAHIESSQGPVYSLVLAKPGKTGPQLTLDSQPCSMEAAPGAPGDAPPAPGGPPPGLSADLQNRCGLQMLRSTVPGRLRAGGKGVNLGLFTMYLTGPFTGIDRPVIDDTGLTGAVDFVIEFTPQFNGPLPPGANFQPDPDGATFLQALQEQLGLKLVPKTGKIDAFVVDHVEEPSPN